MKNINLFSSKVRLSILSLASLFFIAFTGASFGNSFDVAAISFLEESHLSISDEAKNILLSCVSNDRNSTGWTVEIKSDDTIYSLEVIKIPAAKIKSKQNSNNDAAKDRALSRALVRLAVYLDNGKLNRQNFPNDDAANYALLMSYRGKVKGGIQSFSRAMGNNFAVSLVWGKGAVLKKNAASQPKNQLNDDYCKYLYKTANDLFHKKDFNGALKTFHQIHYRAWADVSAYLGASVCFLKMDQKEDAVKLASELINVLSKDMTADEMASAGRILFRAGEKDKGFSTLEQAYKKLKEK